MKHFHFSFHRMRIGLGIYDPAGWCSEDMTLQTMALVRRPVGGDSPCLNNTGKGPWDKLSQPHVGSDPSATEVCNN